VPNPCAIVRVGKAESRLDQEDGPAADRPLKAHDREYRRYRRTPRAGLRDWSGKTLSERRADRATVVREALLSAGMIGNREFGDCRNVWSVAARCVAMVFCPGDQDGRVTSAPVAIRGLP
jgi:hypothetical protein